MGYTYSELVDLMKARNIDSAEVDASMLICHFCGVSRAVLLTDRNKRWESEELSAAVERRLGRYPLQYILGEWEFFGCRFAVSENCLIPRPDTEILVEETLKILPPNAIVCDLCTGSGCIAVSLLKARQDIRAVAVELSEDAMKMACYNAKLNGVEDRFMLLEADVLNDVDKLKSIMAKENIEGFDAIVSNPPYIPSKDIGGLEPELFFEPKMALDGGDDGLVFYRCIIKNYTSLVRRGGYMLLEIGAEQAEDVRALATGKTEVISDLGGNDRVVKLTF